LFVGDVFVRRVTVSLDWLAPVARRLADRLLGRPPRPDVTVTMERLMSRKAAVTSQLEQKRAAFRFEPTPEARGDVASLEEEMGAPPAQPRKEKEKTSLAAEREQESYTERLLKAKQKARDRRQKEAP
jgi:hypothetical protein